MKNYSSINKFVLKPRIFIGSSSESKEEALLVKQCLEHNYDCIVWIDNFFELNENTYKNLIKQSIGFDYAIFIGGVDDAVTRIMNGKSKFAPRDNVYLEFGLYAGILSSNRSFFIIHKSCSIASDLSGITVLEYNENNDISRCCKTIETKIQNEEKINRISLLPSTSLAIGYFENFLKRVSKPLYDLKSIEVESKIYDEGFVDVLDIPDRGCYIIIIIGS